MLTLPINLLLADNENSLSEELLHHVALNIQGLVTTLPPTLKNISQLLSLFQGMHNSFESLQVSLKDGYRKMASSKNLKIKALGAKFSEVEGAVCTFSMKMDIFSYDLTNVKPSGVKPIFEYFKEFYNDLKLIAIESNGQEILDKTENVFKKKSSEISSFMLRHINTKAIPSSNMHLILIFSALVAALSAIFQILYNYWN